MKFMTRRLNYTAVKRLLHTEGYEIHAERSRNVVYSIALYTFHIFHTRDVQRDYTDNARSKSLYSRNRIVVKS